MINNDVLRSIRYMLDLGDRHVVDLIHLADPAFDVDPAQVHDFLRHENWVRGYKAAAEFFTRR